MTLKLEKPMNSSSNGTVWGTVTIASNVPFDSNMDLRMCLEWGQRNHFFQARRRRYAFYGDPASGNFTDFTIATEVSMKKNLTNYNWWCSVPKMEKENRYDFYDYYSSFSLANATYNNNIY
jgi:hypothetical protein